MLDPLTALSIAGTIVQFVDFSSNVLSIAHELYKATSGTTAVNEQLELLTEQFSEQLVKLSRPLGTDGVSGCLTFNEAKLETLCESCQDVARDLIRRLEKLKVKGRRKAWESLSKAIETAWTKHEISTLRRRLRMFKEILEVGVLVGLRESMDLVSLQQSDRFDMLEIKNQQIITALFDQRGSLQGILDRTVALTELLNQLELVVQDETQEMRALIREALQNVDDKTRHFAKDQKTETWKGRFKATSQEEKERFKSAETKILQILWFATKDDRSKTIVKAHRSTCQWMLEEHTTSSLPGSSFVEWLRGDGPTYWINGKAGSGKSTLMKFIYGDERTTTELRKWAGGVPLFTPAFFFWNSGTLEQRSHTGLLRSILYDTLGREPDLIPICFPRLWALSYSHGEHPLLDTRFSLEELATAFEILVNQTVVSMKICIFIDGLDEFHGDKVELIDLLSACYTSPNVKICASSRPLLIFEDHFELSPKIRLQDLTANDMNTYVVSKLTGNKRFQQLSNVEPESAALLIREIVDIANGVFLWVRLATKSLLDGLSNHDQISDLRKRLKQIPTELAGLYAHMLSNIDPFYQVKASEIFQIVRASQQRNAAGDIDAPLTALELSYSIDEDLELAIRSPIGQFLDRDIISRSRAIEDILKSRSLGLLESESPSSEELVSVADSKVRYIHWTAREYLESPEVWERLLAQTRESTFCPHLSCLRACILTLKGPPSPGWTAIYGNGVASIWDRIFTAMWHAYEIDAAADTRYIPLLDELDNVITRRCHPISSEAVSNIRQAHWTNYEQTPVTYSHKGLKMDPKTDFLSFTIQFGLSLYLKERLEKDESVVLKKEGRSLLEYAIKPYNPKSSFHARHKMRPKIIAMLLQHGAKPNRRYLDHSGDAKRNYSCWQTLLTYVSTYKDAPQDDKLRLIKVLKLFVQYGASVNATIAIEDNDNLDALSIVTKTLVQWAPLEAESLRQALISRGAVLGPTMMRKTTNFLILGAGTVLTTAAYGISGGLGHVWKYGHFQTVKLMSFSLEKEVWSKEVGQDDFDVEAGSPLGTDDYDFLDYPILDLVT